jgi:hypothetical protein
MRDKDHPLYNRWKGIKKRCHPKAEYGKLGITVCERWKYFKNFLADMGLPPTPEHTLDRIDNSKGYEPGNVRWANHKQQMTNRVHNPARFLVIDGIDASVRQHAKRLGVPYSTVKKRIMRGWDAREALLLPPKNSSRKSKG